MYTLYLLTLIRNPARYFWRPATTCTYQFNLQDSAIESDAAMKTFVGTLLFVGALYGIWLGLNETGRLPSAFGFLGDDGQVIGGSY